MASLRRASTRLRKYFRENYIPQVCEVLEPRGGGVRRGKNGQRIPRGGTGVWGREEVEVKRSEKKSVLDRTAVWAEHTDQRVEDRGVMVAERGGMNDISQGERGRGLRTETPNANFSGLDKRN